MTFEEYATQRIEDIRLGKVVVDNSAEAIAALEENLRLVSSPTPPLLAFDGDLLAFYIPANQAWCVQFKPKQDSKLNLEFQPFLPYYEAANMFNDIITRVREESGN